MTATVDKVLAIGHKREQPPPVNLIHLNGSETDLEHSGCTASSSDRCTQLLHDIYGGLLNPSVELSAAAAKKMPLSAQFTLSPDNTSAIFHDSTNSSSTLRTIRTATTCTASVNTLAAGGKVRSLPVELLYDDLGLSLFEEITHLPEYYLTAAEADILAIDGQDIVESCVPNQGAVLVELGAGSMRKTRLLLDAVLATGRTDVTFCALDLCQDPLNNALQALQGLYQGRIKLVGLVGTYHQGLAHLQQQQQQHKAPLGLSKQLHSVSSIPLHLSSSAGCIPTPEPHLTSLNCTASSSTTSSSADGLSKRTASYLTWEEELLLLQHPPSVEGLALYTTTTSSSSSSISDSAEGGSVSGASSNACSHSRSCTPEADDMCPTPSSEPCQLGARGKSAAAAAAVAPAAAGKVLMWLGSSIGNLSRSEAAMFLAQLKEAAMQPGDVLLVGIDRRNSAEKVQLAYNDPAGVTRAFILNGLKHCKHLLDKQLQGSQATDDNSSCPPGVNMAVSSSSCSSCSSMKLDDFSYFCLYNEELGRHEAYYQASRDTTIMLPAAAAGATCLVPTAHAAAAAAPAGPEDDCTEQDSAASCQLAATNCPPGSIAVPIAAGELIHVEYSHKYSKGEVDQLAAAAGLKWVKAWTDSKQQYDLHMLTL